MRDLAVLHTATGRVALVLVVDLRRHKSVSAVNRPARPLHTPVVAPPGRNSALLVALVWNAAMLLVILANLGPACNVLQSWCVQDRATIPSAA